MILQELKTAIKRDEHLVPAAFLAIGILDAIPIPTDIGFFYTQKWLRENKSKLTPKQYWAYQYLNYYGWDVAWYLSLFGITWYAGKGPSQKLTIGLGLVSMGALATMLWRFSKEDEGA